MSKEKYIILDEMPSRGAFTEVWTHNGHSCSRSCQYVRGKLMTWDYYDEVDLWREYEPLKSQQYNPLYILALAEKEV